MKNLRLDRRALLRGAGGVAIGLPLLDIMQPVRRVEAADGAPPVRFIVFFSPNGTIHQNWVPKGAGTSFTLSTILKPLEPNQKSIVVIDGCDNAAGSRGPGDQHQRGMGSGLTGIQLLAGNNGGNGGAGAGLAGGISVDQTIANKIGTTTKFKSLELGIQSRQQGSVWGYTSYAAANMPLPPNNDPTAVFTRVFGSVGAAAGTVDKQAVERKSVLDAVMASYQKLNPKLGAEDKAKLDAHLATIRDLEGRLASGNSTGAAPGGQCGKPATPALSGTATMTNSNFPAVGQSQMDLMVMAMACDLTRVGTLQWSHSFADPRFDFVDKSITRGHHTISHDADSNADSMTKLTEINTWYATQLNYLIEALKKVPEGGGTMLDNTVVLWCNELGKGNSHSMQYLPYVLAGGGGGKLVGGRFLQYNHTPHNNLLLALVNLFGVTDKSFGNPTYCTGPLAGLLM